MASHETPSKPKNVGKSGKNASFQRVALSPQNWLGLNSWAQLGFGGPTCPKLGPKLRCLGPNWHPSWRQLVIDGFQIEAMRCAWKSKSILTCRNLRALAASSHQVGPNGDNMENLASNEAPSIAKKLGKYRWKRAFWRFRIGPAMPPIWSHMDVNLVWSCSQMGVTLGPRCAILEPSWAEVGAKSASWAEVGVILAEVDPSWANVAAMLDRNGPSGRFWADLRTVQITSPVRFFAPCPRRTWPPHLYHFHLQLQHDNTQLDVDIHWHWSDSRFINAGARCYVALTSLYHSVCQALFFWSHTACHLCMIWVPNPRGSRIAFTDPHMGGGERAATSAAQHGQNQFLISLSGGEVEIQPWAELLPARWPEGKDSFTNMERNECHGDHEVSSPLLGARDMCHWVGHVGRCERCCEKSCGSTEKQP